MESIHLFGAEEVANAGRAISRAAAEMTNVASSIECSLQMHQRFLDDWLSRFENILEEDWRRKINEENKD